MSIDISAHNIKNVRVKTTHKSNSNALRLEFEHDDKSLTVQLYDLPDYLWKKIVFAFADDKTVDFDKDE